MAVSPPGSLGLSGPITGESPSSSCFQFFRACSDAFGGPLGWFLGSSSPSDAHNASVSALVGALSQLGSHLWPSQGFWAKPGQNPPDVSLTTTMTTM